LLLYILSQFLVEGCVAIEQFVYIIRNSLEHPSDVSETVRKFHKTYEVDRKDALDFNFKGSLIVIVDIPLQNARLIKSIQNIMKNPTLRDIPTLFILGEESHREIVQSSALGATDFISSPINEEAFIKAITKLANMKVESSWSKLSKIQEGALKASLKVFEDTFDHVREGKVFSQGDVLEGCNLIIKATAESGVTSWVNAVKEHHNQTYRHSMMVCGYLVSFGMILGVKGEDLQRLSICGLVHDIGKAFIPLSILDKPGKLSEQDWVIMRKHPVHTRDVLLKSDCDDDILAGAIHHHEKLDGSGYPDGLAGDDISDFARLVAVADVFSGLTEKRAYKKSMTGEQAYDVMLDMGGHLDIDLVKAFKPVALNMS